MTAAKKVTRKKVKQTNARPTKKDKETDYLVYYPGLECAFVEDGHLVLWTHQMTGRTYHRKELRFYVEEGHVDMLEDCLSELREFLAEEGETEEGLKLFVEPPGRMDAPRRNGT
jgi:hypothetical protein